MNISSPIHANSFHFLSTIDGPDAAFLLDLLSNRVPPGVDESAYVKAAFLSAVAKKEASSPILTRQKATELLATMQVRSTLKRPT